MTDQELAAEIVQRLNRLIEDPLVRADVHRLIEARVPCCKATADHPTIQSQVADGQAPGMLREIVGPVFDGVFYRGPLIGFLGLLNGLVGVIPEGPMKDWGLIAAVYDDAGALLHFRLTL